MTAGRVVWVPSCGVSDDAGSVEAACHWCGEPVDHPPAGVCDRCKARLRAAEAARQRPSALWPRSRIEVGHTADTILGAPVTLSFIQAFRNSFSLRFDLESARAEVQGTGALNPQRRLLGPWDAWDDAGNEYPGIGGEGGQTGSSSSGDIWFVPALDPGATELTIAATSRGETLFHTTFALGERSPWSPMAPRSTHMMPRDERPYSAVLEQIIQIVTGIGPPFDPPVEHLLHQADAFHARGLGRLEGMIASCRGEIFLDAVMADEVAGTLLAAYGLGGLGDPPHDG